MLAPVISLSRPECCACLAVAENVPAPNEGLSQAELVVPAGCRLTVDDRLGKSCVAGRVCCVGLQHDLRFHPCPVRVRFRVKPVVHKDELAVSLRFITEAIFGQCARRFECDLLSTYAVQTVAGTKISMEFELPYLSLKALNLGLSLL